MRKYFLNIHRKTHLYVKSPRRCDDFKQIISHHDVTARTDKEKKQSQRLEQTLQDFQR